MADSFPVVQKKIFLKDADGLLEVVSGGDQEVDVVEVFSATEAMGEVVARVDGGLEFAAVRAEKTKTAFAAFGVRRAGAQASDDTTSDCRRSLHNRKVCRGGLAFR